ncbi:MAG: Uma2 family endonuclease [Haliscomenobacter sp.]|uniref:Uma2 family endonuclease n=1 Tax=Haliscomenobacter sp. TaxID=2717303 RepID=UPI0029A6231A|nr:Uma2 family endonuclease [Haliscomenobacter sp.]MDX2067555.1 Uma2 family endonuclease [Haliscomenobacter sp.]
MTITASQIFTIEEYLELEAHSLSKHEYHNGKIIEMAGGTTTHNELSGKLITQLNIAIDAKDAVFKVYSSDMKIWIEKFNRFLYPDAVTIALKPELYNNRRDIITNPLLVVEVTSPSSQGYDNNSKFGYYRSIPSFSEYLLVSQEQHHVSRFFREAPDLWRTSDYYNLEDMIPLQSMGLEIPMLGIYKGVDLNP